MGVVSLVGLMGAGKSTVARALAARWEGFVALDLDELIAARAGTSIAELFAMFGEPYFRALEQSLLNETLAGTTSIVLATGGGAPCQTGAMERLLLAGPVVWLDAPPAVLVARALTASRPLLKDRRPADAEAFLAALLATRAPFYARADLKIAADQDLDTILQDIDAGLAALGRTPRVREIAEHIEPR